MMSSLPDSPAEDENQQFVRGIFNQRGIVLEEIDGKQAKNIHLRNRLWALSAEKLVPNSYPQIFIKNGDDYKFIGDFDSINYAAEYDGNFDEIFANCQRAPRGSGAGYMPVRAL